MILKAFDVKDEGDIMPEDIDEGTLINLYHLVAIRVPGSAEYDGKSAFNRNLLKPKYKFLLEVMQKSFMGHHGTFEVVTQLKFQVMAAIILKLDMNWARFLLKLLCVEASLIKLEYAANEEDLIKVIVSRSLHLGAKVSLLLLKTYGEDRNWSKAVEYSKAYPTLQYYLERLLRINM